MDWWIIGLVVLAVLLVALTLPRSRKISGYTSEGDSKFDEVIRTLYRQSARYAIAGSQDRSDMIALLHANYGAGYLWALKDICSTDEFLRATGEDFLSFEKKVTSIQDAISRRVATTCRDVLPVNDKELLRAMYYSPPDEN